MSSEMYPERRPYATTVPHSGYLAKPFLPPVEALRILNSTIGIDAPRSLRREYLQKQQQHHQPRRPETSMATKRTSQRPSSSIGLAMPFAFKEKDYHASQQVALNAQLNNALEELFKIWRRKVQDLQSHLSTYPAQASTSFSLTTDAMMAYFDGYRATDVPPVLPETLAQDFKLTTKPGDLDSIQKAPVLTVDRIRRTLDTLLNANHFLAPLEHYVQDLEALDKVATASAETGDASGATSLSRSAVALHEKFHYDPAEYAMRELRRSDTPIERLERRVLEAAEMKEQAIDASQPGEALQYLMTQVELANDLLLMNKARFELVRLHARDVRELRPLIEHVIADAQNCKEQLKNRITDDLPKVRQDMEKLRKDVGNTVEHLEQLDMQNNEANAAARNGYAAVDDKERELWSALLEIMQKLVHTSNEKDEFVRREMKLREQRARDKAMATELLNTQRQYYERLRAAEETLWRWSNASQIFDAYVDAYIPKLRRKADQVEETGRDLYNRESQAYVRRYEMFEYAVEEGRATRQVYADRIKILRRSKQLDAEQAEATLDPNRAKYDTELAAAQTRLDEAQAYVDYVLDLDRERREEVEPILQEVIAFNRTMQSQLPALEAGTGSGGSSVLQHETPQLIEAPPSTTTTATTTGITTTTSAAAAAAAGGEDVSPQPQESGEMVRGEGTLPLWLRTTDTQSQPLMATVAHPHVQARNIGINHEEAFLEKFHRFADEEQAAVEDVVGKIRKSRNQTDLLGIKYNNTDYVRMTLGSGSRK